MIDYEKGSTVPTRSKKLGGREKFFFFFFLLPTMVFRE